MDRCFYAAYARGIKRIERCVVAEAGTDLWPSGRGFFRFPKWLPAAVAGIILVALGLLNMDILARSGLKVIAHFTSNPPPAVADTHVAYQQYMEKEEPGDHQEKDAIGMFLASYGLDEYKSSLRRALEQGSLKQLARQIKNATGWQMVRLDRSGHNTDLGHNILQYNDTASGKSFILLFWQPSIVLKYYYYDYKGPEIVALQHALAGLGYYKGPLDGLVGRGLMRAVVDFQRKCGLPVTGRPGPATLFLIFNAQEKIAHG